MRTGLETAHRGRKSRKTACPEGLKSQAGQAIMITKNREKNVLIINAPLSPIKRYFFLSRKGRKSEGKRGVCGGCGNVVNP